jgi:hypothetical protein
MWGDGDSERAPSSTIKGNHQQLTIYRTSRLKTFAVPNHGNVMLKVVDALAAAEGGHHTSQWPFPAITSIVIVGSQKSLLEKRTLVSKYQTDELKTIRFPPS